MTTVHQKYESMSKADLLVAFEVGTIPSEELEVAQQVYRENKTSNTVGSMDKNTMFYISVACFVLTGICFISGQSLIEENIFGGSGQSNGVRLVYASYLTGLIGAVFLLAGLIRK